MSDFLSVITPNTNLTVADYDAGIGPGASNSLATGDIRRRYNFGSRVSELAIPQDPFFRFVSKVAKKPTDDPQFKFTEKRPSFHKRYAYCMGFVTSAGADSFGDATLTASNDGGTPVVADDTVKLYMAGDYKSQGNIQNVYGQTNNKVDVGVSGTTPQFFLPGQLVKVPMNSATYTAANWGSDYILIRITEVDTSPSSGAAIDSKYPALITGKVVRATSGTAPELSGWDADNFSPGNAVDGDEVVSDQAIHSVLEPSRSYVVGTAHQEGSGFPETWVDQPYASQYGVTQIWKTSMAMTNTARATVLKFEPNEWARVWKEKLIEHKWDIETSLLFGSQYEDSTGGINYTQGAVDYITSYGNTFSLSTSTKTQDDFLDDLSSYVDPRYNNSQATIFFCNTAVYNWLHKLSGYFANNIGSIQPFTGGTADTTASDSTKGVGRAEMSLTGRKKVFGVDVTTISTVYGDMNVARNIHLDGTNVKLLGINMKNCSYRPLVGNGINRDTSVYVGVQTLENSGVDRRVDQILTEAGMEWSMAESHAIWT
jgi:hypothetical protein